ncbi:flavodoxin family protein [Orenia marismortui]|uniref:flavodoxin family protein n=1 Tax=Orenia marismortui TaxID=46469 RepID=UPI000360DB00|nr:flavodoxin domain-containing protein [Orenia marismortui]
MKKAIIIHDAVGEKAEKLSNELVKYLSDDYDVLKKSIAHINIEELNDFDLIILGSANSNFKISQDGFINLYNSLTESDIDLSNKKLATFCPIDKKDLNFCETVDVIEKELKNMGLELANEGLKCDGDLNPQSKEEIKRWIKKVSSNKVEVKREGII